LQVLDVAGNIEGCFSCHRLLMLFCGQTWFAPGPSKRAKGGVP
jgi:hypothetical protein